MRLFTAIELSDAGRAAVAAEQQRVIAALGRSARALRLVKPEQLHVTLVFIGDVPDDRVPSVVEVMQGEIPIERFRIALGGIGAFPPRGAPRVLFLGLVEGAAQMNSVYDQVADRLAGVGVAREVRPFHPHVTLGRWRESGPGDRPGGTAPRPIARVDVRAATLFQSRLSSSGPVYTALAAAPLICP